MKALLLLAALATALPVPPAEAAGEGLAWEALVVDKDPKGTNLRESPSGQVVKVIPMKKGLRVVKIMGQAADWFNVEVDGVAGWMHGSVLGSCASATEDGDPSLSRSPRNDSPSVAKIASGAPVSVLGMEREWLKVRYVDAKGNRQEGWLPEQAVAMSEGELERCAKAWANK